MMHALETAGLYQQAHIHICQLGCLLVQSSHNTHIHIHVMHALTLGHHTVKARLQDRRHLWSSILESRSAITPTISHACRSHKRTQRTLVQVEVVREAPLFFFFHPMGMQCELGCRARLCDCYAYDEECAGMGTL
jgi:hypothetical protein